MDDLALHVGEAEVSAVMMVGQAFMIPSHDMKDGGVEVVDVNGVFGDFTADLVRGSVDGPSLDGASG